MRITENFDYPHSDDPTQISVLLSEEGAYVTLTSSRIDPKIHARDLGTLIGMLQALQRRAAREPQNER
jgi:hypothetical protein